MANHEDMDSSEHQIRLSKGLIAKFAQSLKLEARISTRQMKKPPVGWLFLFSDSVTELCLFQE